MSTTNSDSKKPKSICSRCKHETIGEPVLTVFNSRGMIAPSPLELIKDIYIASRQLIHRTVDCQFKCTNCGHEWTEEIEL